VGVEWLFEWDVKKGWSMGEKGKLDGGFWRRGGREGEEEREEVKGE
jgi:hypothetical protein